MKYGYLWWIDSAGRHNCYYTMGYGGQCIMLIPDLEMIIVTTADHSIEWEKAYQQNCSLHDLINNYILISIIN